MELPDLPDTGTCDLVTTGRRSGRPRAVEIWFVRSGRQLHVTGTPGTRHWLANIRADPGVRIRWHGSEIHALAEEITDPRRT